MAGGSIAPDGRALVAGTVATSIGDAGIYVPGDRGFVRRLIAERRIPFCKIGKFVRFDPYEIEEWIESQRVAAFELD